MTKSEENMKAKAAAATWDLWTVGDVTNSDKVLSLPSHLQVSKPFHTMLRAVWDNEFDLAYYAFRTQPTGDNWIRLEAAMRVWQHINKNLRTPV